MGHVQRAVAAIAELVREGRREEALRRIERLECHKPVPLAVANARASYYAATGDYQRFWACFPGKTQLDVIGEDELESLRLRAGVCRDTGDDFWAVHHEYIYHYLNYRFSQNAESGEFLRCQHLEMADGESGLVGDIRNPGACHRLASTYIKQQRVVEAAVCLSAGGLLAGEDFLRAGFSWVLRSWPNLSQLHAIVTGPHGWAVVLMKGGREDGARCETLARVLSAAGKEARLLEAPSATQGGERHWVEVVETCPGRASSGQASRIRRFRPTTPGEPRVGGSRPLHELLGEWGRKGALLLAPETCVEDLGDEPKIRGFLHRVTPNYYGEHYRGCASAAFLGEYTDFAEAMYQIPVGERVRRKSEVLISVVLPTRNSVHTLRHTLRTCLNQSFPDFEVVVSDNSSLGNEETLQLVDGIGDPRVRYFRAPCELSLTKHFEFAFLQARGEFLFSIGSDDGVVFDAIEALARVLERLPDDDIVQWDRLFYAWADFSVVPQRGQFFIPRPYVKHEIDVVRYRAFERLELLARDPETLYMMPMLYINSGFRRRFMNKLLERTGRLWHGEAQDLYMGWAVMALNESIPVVHYPITLSGLCNSAGSKSTIDKGDEGGASRFAKESEGIRAGTHIDTRMERLVPWNSSDRSALYRSFLRLVQTDCDGRLRPEMLDIPKILEGLARSMRKDDVRFDVFAKLLQVAARKQGDGFYEHFTRDVLAEVGKQKHFGPEKTPDGAKCYTEGFSPDGSLTLDGGKFGVTNAYEACELFRKITGI